MNNLPPVMKYVARDKYNNIYYFSDKPTAYKRKSWSFWDLSKESGEYFSILTQSNTSEIEIEFLLNFPWYNSLHELIDGKWVHIDERQD